MSIGMLIRQKSWSWRGCFGTWVAAADRLNSAPSPAAADRRTVTAGAPRSSPGLVLEIDDRQAHRARVRGVEIDRVPGDARDDVAPRQLAGVRVDVEPGRVRAGDVHRDPVALFEG